MFFLVSGCLTCVQVLNIMVLLGFMLNYALRVNLTIAIVEMVYDTKNHTIANLTEHINGTVEVRTKDFVSLISFISGSSIDWLARWPS